MTRGLWKCSGRADDGASYCFYELRDVAGLGPIPFRFVIVSVEDFWGAK